MDKRTFKICEAVHLGLDYYDMAKARIKELKNEINRPKTRKGITKWHT